MERGADVDPQLITPLTTARVKPICVRKWELGCDVEMLHPAYVQMVTGLNRAINLHENDFVSTSRNIAFKKGVICIKRARKKVLKSSSFCF